MENNSRTKNTLYIMFSGILFQVISLILGFINRTVFVKFLGVEYLGLNSLFTNILSLLSLAELGFGTASTYFMYKPLAENDEERLKVLTNFYKIAYRTIGIVIFIIGVSLIPFLNYLVKFDNSIDINLKLVYILFLINTVSSYLFFAYRSNIISADQKDYLLNTINCKFVVLSTILEIGAIVLFKNFILSLIIGILMDILKNIVIAKKASDLYPFIKEKSKEKLSKDFLKDMFKKIYSIFIIRISSQLFNSTDNMIISAFIGTKYVGFNANYLLIIASATRLINIIKGSFRATVGNINAVESIDKKYIMFKRLDFFNFWISSFSAICFFQLLNPFIQLWLGKEFLFSDRTVYIIVANYFTTALLSIVFMYRETMGLFDKGKYYQLIGGIVNIGLSIYLSKYLGIDGIFLATLIAGVLITILPFPIILYKYGFNKSGKEYIYLYLRNCILTIIMCFLVNKACSILGGLNYKTFMIQMIICIILPNLIYIIIFRKSEEFIYFKEKIYEILKSKEFKVRLGIK